MDNGTRLGHNGPKGTFKINVNPESKYLFEIIVDTLKRANKKYQITIPWYIMTSNENNFETIKFFEEKNYFNYPKENIKFFIQGEMPLLDMEGQLILDETGIIKQASDGNGSIYKSMQKNGILKDMNQRKIEWIYICSVDNILLQIIEPLLLGLTVFQNNLIASKTIVKANPEEKVGVFCKKNNKPYVIEYTELSKEMAKKVDKNGELIYGESHIMCNLFNIKAIEKIAQQDLPYHVALKKINYIKDGKLIQAQTPNVNKFESFIFDAFSIFNDITLLRGKREENFAPVKNKEGIDSPQTAIKLYNDFWENKK